MAHFLSHHDSLALGKFPETLLSGVFMRKAIFLAICLFPIAAFSVHGRSGEEANQMICTESKEKADRVCENNPNSVECFLSRLIEKFNCKFAGIK